MVDFIEAPVSFMPIAGITINHPEKSTMNGMHKSMDHKIYINVVYVLNKLHYYDIDRYIKIYQ